MEGGKDKPKVRIRSGLNPGSTLHNCAMLRTISPAPIDSTSAMAISKTTNAFSARWLALMAPRPPSLSAACGLNCELRSAGANPKRMPTSSEIAMVKIRT